MRVIGTAGHVDHGKSTLVKALTGVDPDRLEEEKARGMTIELGFAFLQLPSGAAASIVDVPGHERFVRNMLAGAGGVDIALLVVAADEVVMPQTREHLDILNLLGVPQGVVALTKVDLVDDEWLDLAAAEIGEMLDGTSLAGSPVVPVSALSGRGLDELLHALDTSVLAGQDGVDKQRPFLPVDRSFSRPGFGTIVTGTLHGGSVRQGEEVEIVPSGRRARIRSVQMHGAEVEAAGPGARVALNLTGIHRKEIRRGDVVARPHSVAVVRRFDATLRVLPSSPVPVSHDLETAVYVGSAERSAHLAVLGGTSIDPGQTGWVQVRLREPVGCVPGQRFIVRLPSPVGTIAGGEVLDVRPARRRPHARLTERLEALASAQPERMVLAALEGERPRTLEQIQTALPLGPGDVQATLNQMEREGRVVHMRNWYLDADAWSRILPHARAVLEEFYRTYPLRPGIPAEEVRQRLALPQAAWQPLLEKLLEAQEFERHDGLVALRGRGSGLGSVQGQVQQVLSLLAEGRFSPPGAAAVAEATGSSPELLEAMARSGDVVRVGQGMYFERAVYDEMVERTLVLIKENGSVSVAQLRDDLGTSRKHALAFLEHLDAQRITVRTGESRVLGIRAPACA